MTESAAPTGEALEAAYRRIKLRGNRLILLGLLFLLVVTGISFLLRPAALPDYDKIGIHLLLDDGRGAWPTEIWPEHLDYARRLVGEGGYVVQLVRADDLDPARWQRFMDLAAEHKLRPIIRLSTIYDHDKRQWQAPQTDSDGTYATIAAQYADFIAALEWPSEPKYVILLNEPNRGDEWGGRPDPAAYARFVIEVSAALRSADPQVKLLNGALDLYAPNTGSQPFIDGTYYLDAETFLDAMHSANPDALRQIDIWNSHPYPLGAFREGPWRESYQFDFVNDAVSNADRPPPGLYNRGINGYEWELWKLARFGIGPLPVMITETGWRHNDPVDSAAADDGENYPDPETLAIYLDLAMRGGLAENPERQPISWQPWLSDERVLAVIPFALNGAPKDWSHTNWLRLSENGEVLGVYPVFDLVASYPR